MDFLGENQVKDCVQAALKQSGLCPASHKDAWIQDFLVESITAELAEGVCPATAQEAQDKFQDLIYGNLKEVEADDLQDFCSILHSGLQQAILTAQADADSGNEECVGGCAICEREMPLTFHHLIPRELHDRYKKRGLTADELQAGILVCRPCHSAIHRTYDNKTLAAQYNTLEQLQQSEPLQKFAKWARKQRLVSKADTTAAGFRYRR